MKQVIMTLHEFLLQWLRNPEFREANPDLKQAMKDCGLGDVTGEEVHQAAALVADELPAVQAQQLTSYFNASSGAHGGNSSINVQQGSGAAAAAAGGSAPPPPPLEPMAGETHLDAAVKQIQYITNNITNVTETNITNIDDRDTIVDNSVQQQFSAGGDIALDQDITNNVASGDGAVAGEVSGNVNTGQNSGIVGDTGGTATVTNVDGDGNTVTGDVSGGSNVVSGDVSGQFVGGSLSDSNLIGGDNTGIAAADGNVTGAAVGDGNTVIGADGHIGNVNLGGTQTNVEGSENTNLGGDQTVVDAVGSAVNTGDYGDATLDQSIDNSQDNSQDNSINVDVALGSGSDADRIDLPVEATLEELPE